MLLLTPEGSSASPPGLLKGISGPEDQRHTPTHTLTLPFLKHSPGVDFYFVPTIINITERTLFLENMLSFINVKYENCVFLHVVMMLL